jgi:hypothetical protein
MRLPVRSTRDRETTDGAFRRDHHRPAARVESLVRRKAHTLVLRCSEIENLNSHVSDSSHA